MSTCNHLRFVAMCNNTKPNTTYIEASLGNIIVNDLFQSHTGIGHCKTMRIACIYNKHATLTGRVSPIYHVLYLLLVHKVLIF